MPRAYERVTDQIFNGLNDREGSFERIFYEEVRWWGCRFESCIWRDCKFRRISFSKNTLFSHCRFQNCRFWAQHTYLGGPTTFQDCEFIDCSFVNIQFWDTEFVRCSFTGKFQNLIFFGPDAPRGWQTTLRDVDFTGVRMEDTDFRTGIDLETTRLPDTTKWISGRIWEK